MSKTVKIPTCMSPFEVMVNGKKHTFPAGQTVEVPDEVALVIERHWSKHERQPSGTQKPFAGGGSADWNASEGEAGHVKNRTHYAETATLLDNATVVGGLVKIDTIGTFNEGQTYRVVFDGVPYDCIGVNWDGTVYLGNGAFDDYNFGNNEPFLIVSNSHFAEIMASDKDPHTISIVGEVVHKIDPKYISGIFPRVLYATENRMYADEELTIELSNIEMLWNSDIFVGRQVFVCDTDNDWVMYLITNVGTAGYGGSEVHCGHKVFYYNGYVPAPQ